MQKETQDLISLPIEKMEAVSETKFRLVHIASQRVRQLSMGAPIEVDTKSIKDTTIALEEALMGKLRIMTGEEALIAKEEFRKREERAKLDAQLSAKEEEIRKELTAYLSEAAEEEGSGESDESDEGAVAESDDTEMSDEDADEPDYSDEE